MKIFSIFISVGDNANRELKNYVYLYQGDPAGRPYKILLIHFHNAILNDVQTGMSVLLLTEYMLKQIALK